MSVTAAELITLVRSDALRDSGATQKWSDTQILRFINSAIRLSYPRVFVHVTDATTPTAETDNAYTRFTNVRYTLPAGVPTYPQRIAVRKVSIGPIRAELNAGDLPGSDLWLPVDWAVDWGGRQLVLAKVPLFDRGATYTYYVRVAYCKPVPILAAADTLAAPDNFAEAILEFTRLRAFENIARSAITDNERLQGIGSLMRSSKESFTEIMDSYGVRMLWPPLVGYRPGLVG